MRHSSSPSDTSDDDDEWNSKKKVTKKTKKTKMRDVIRDDSSSTDTDDDDDVKIKSNANSAEEGELSSSSASDASGSDGSEFDEEELRKQFDDGYDDKLVGDEEDRRRLDEMTEKEREQILYERLEKREALQKRFEIEKKLRLNKMKNKGGLSRQKKKRKKVVSPLQESEGQSRRNERRRAMEDKKEKNSQLEDLMAERERKKNKEKKLTEKGKLDIKQLFPSDSSDNDDEVAPISMSRKAGRVSDSETSTDSSASSNSDSEPEEPAKYKRIETKGDLNRLRWTRNSLGKYVHHPFFKELVVGGYCRVGIGNNSDQKPIYRACEIVDVCETSKVYTVQLANGQSSKTNIGLRLKHGPQERVFRILFTSNAEFTENEFIKFKSVVESGGSQLPTIDEMKKKLVKIQNLKSKKLDDEAVNHIIKQKKKFRKTPFNYAIAKTTLLKEKEMHQQQENDAEAKKVQQKLEELEEKAEKLDKIRSENIAGITYINANIKKYNLKKEEASKKEFASRQKNHSDPFTRRRCAPVIVSNTADGEQTQRLIAEMERRYGSGGKKEEEGKDSDEGESKSEAAKKNQDESIDLYEAHNFDIKLDIDISPEIGRAEPSFVAPKVAANSASNNQGSAPKRSLNLSDYKKRRGLI